MTAPSDLNLLSFYATPPHECSYLDRDDAVTVFADPDYPKSKKLYSSISQYGFRRSGQHLYKPHCESCQQCIAVRIPVNDFKPNRSQRRCWKKNQDLTITAVNAEFKQEHFDLYGLYQASQHPGGGMDNSTEKQYREFLTSDWSDTVFYEFRKEQQLVAVAVVDMLVNAFSAVYTFYDPAEKRRSPGTYAILWEIEQARRAGMQWLYLGYWIENCQKMNYKVQFRPIQFLRDGIWQT